MVKKIGIGIHDFKTLIDRDYYYVDKTMFIYDILHEAKPVTILPRPRRFGKTLNMSMLQYFFEKHPKQSDNRHLFNDLAITNYPEIMERQGQYPVIFITFKGVKYNEWDDCYDKIQSLIAQEYMRHEYVLQDNALNEHDKIYIKKIMDKKGSLSDVADSLFMLSKILYAIHNQKVIILIDEYDAPMQSGFEFNYYEEIKNFMYSFFCSGLKDNNYLEFSVITGILRIAKDSLFSGMNNSASYSMLDDAFADKFGFTDQEVTTILDYFQTPIEREKVREWYNGYRFGLPKYDKQGHEHFTMIYNPWSIIECINKKALGAHWVNTGGHMLIQETMRRASAEDKEHLLKILDGGSVEKTINDTIVFRDVQHDSNAMWSFLVFTGYLTWKSRTPMVGKTTASLIAPNFEVLDSLKSMITAWFVSYGIENTFKEMVNALININLPYFEELFIESVMASVSFFDVPKVRPENMYHAFVLGMFVSLADTHVVTSNLEAGKGRYDVAIIPKDKTKPGIVFEFKRKLKKDATPLAEVAQGALEQIDERKYTLPLKKQGITSIAKIGIAFQGKEVEMAFAVEGD
ncbi:MAG: hypothetical protein US69_C0024G0002 [candidate division TM6 bacterium GW2011_GWF2_38_10]|nr:MAG: hypothetical protein US69_C0024G0002 [candidate division TM6 bacterium GW2011_GWF2_38_10]